jgi:integrase
VAVTDTVLKSAKPGLRPKKISDSGGLFLLIQPTGARLWRWSYRYDGKQRTISFGSYPATTLAEARAAREAAKKLLKAGTDPSAKRKADKAAERIGTETLFGAVAADLIAKKEREGRAEGTMERFRWLVGLALPDLKDRPVNVITAPEILTILRRIEERGHLESARRCRAVIGEVIRHGIACGYATGDPTSALRRAIAAPKPRHFAAITDPKAFGALLRAIDDYPGQYVVRAALQLAALTAPRPGELRHATWPEFDLEAGIWTIPAAHTKLRREHRIPLAQQAVAILTRLRDLTGKGKDALAFPGTRAVTRPISDATLGAALRRLGYAQGEVTAHGFRASFSTMANQSGLWSADAIEKALAHEDENSIRRAYQRSDFWDERVRMMSWWADYLDTLREVGKVIPLVGRSA